jgi:hypothetical protein
MRVWQVRGGRISMEPIGWNLLRLDEALRYGRNNENSLGPRAGC